MPRDSAILKICLIAGEASGDALGARLMQAIKRETATAVHFSGVGGPQMEAEGLQSIFPMRDISVMGIAEVLPKLAKILARIRQTVSFIKREHPDIVVTIDSPDFCFRVARKVKASSAQPPRMVHYVAPTVWAWRPERAKKVAKLYDGMMCLYPFEPPYFEAEGLASAFTGHSVLGSGCGKGNGAALRRELGIPEDAAVLGVLFGSRMGELNRVGPVLHDAAVRIAAANGGMHIISPTFPHLGRQTKNLLRSMDCKTHVITDQKRKWDCFAAMDMALATSGTVGLELAVADVPHVIAYKMSPLTAQIVRRKVTVKYAHLVNILLDQPAVPEFIQEKCTAAAIAESACGLMAQDGGAQPEAFAKARNLLLGSSKDDPSVQAARFVLDNICLRSSLKA